MTLCDIADMEGEINFRIRETFYIFDGDKSETFQAVNSFSALSIVKYTKT